MKPGALTTFLFLVCTGILFGDSLWEENNQGLLSDQSFLKTGQVVQIVIDSETQFAFTSYSTGDKRIMLEFTGGEGGELFSFLPSGASSESGSRKGSEELSMKASLATRVREFDESGMAFVSGSRTVVFQNGTQQVNLEGWINPADVDASMTISLEMVSDVRFEFSSFLDPVEPLLKSEDLTEAAGPAEEVAELTEPAAPETGVAEPGLEEPGIPEGTEVEAEEELPVTAAGYTLDDEKKKELLLSYINRFLDIIFMQQ